MSRKTLHSRDGAGKPGGVQVDNTGKPSGMSKTEFMILKKLGLTFSAGTPVTKKKKPAKGVSRLLPWNW